MNSHPALSPSPGDEGAGREMWRAEALHVQMWTVGSSRYQDFS